MKPMLMATYGRGAHAEPVAWNAMENSITMEQELSRERHHKNINCISLTFPATPAGDIEDETHFPSDSRKVRKGQVWDSKKRDLSTSPWYLFTTHNSFAEPEPTTISKTILPFKRVTVSRSRRRNFNSCQLHNDARFQPAHMCEDPELT